MAGSSNESPSKREEARAALVAEAIRRPGIREIMDVYENWRHADRGLDPYRAATRWAFELPATDHSNPG